jgi:hypothetical protein
MIFTAIIMQLNGMDAFKLLNMKFIFKISLMIIVQYVPIFYLEKNFGLNLKDYFSFKKESA